MGWLWGRKNDKLTRWESVFLYLRRFRGLARRVKRLERDVAQLKQLVRLPEGVGHVEFHEHDYDQDINMGTQISNDGGGDMSGINTGTQTTSTSSGLSAGQITAIAGIIIAGIVILGAIVAWRLGRDPLKASDVVPTPAPTEQTAPPE